MKLFIYKTLFISLVIVILFEIIIGSKLKFVEKKLFELKNKQNILMVKEKIFKEIENGSKKENYFSEKEKVILINFIKKIKSELSPDN